MPQLVAVIIRDLFWVFFFSPSFLIPDFGCINSGGRGVFGFPLLSMLLLFFVFSSLIGTLRIGKSGRESRDGTFTSGFIPTIHGSLGLDFMRNNVSKLIPLEDLYISLTYIETWL